MMKTDVQQQVSCQDKNGRQADIHCIIRFRTGHNINDDGTDASLLFP